MKKDFFYLLILFLIPGCMVGPKHTLPAHAMPKAFSISYDSNEQEPLACWWKQFHDETLNDLINQALDYNYDLKIALEKIEESRALYEFRQAELYPTMDGVGLIQSSRFPGALLQNSSTVAPLKRKDQFYLLGALASWELDFWGKLRHARNAQYFTLKAQIEDMHAVKIILIAETAQRYIDLCAITQKIDLTRKKINLDKKIVAIQNDLYEAGLASAIDSAAQEQVLASTRDQLAQLNTIKAQTHNQLAVLLGLNPDQLKLPDLPSTVPLSDYSINTGLPSDLLRRRPDIRQAEQLAAAKNEELGAIIAQGFPSFNLLGGVAAITNIAAQWLTCPSLSWLIGPSMNAPLLTFGRVQANIHVQESIKRQALLNYTKTIINALKDVENFLTGYYFAQEELSILQKKYTYASQEESLISSRYTAGINPEIDSINAQKNTLMIALEVSTASQSLSNQLIGLYKALGGGW